MRPHRLAAQISLALASGCAGWAAAGQPVPAPLQLDTVHVIGSRLHTSTPAGIGPVAVYDRSAIEATGAMRLADFLNYLPQNYTGASTGRTSAPNDFNPEFGVRSESSVPPFNIALGSADVPLGQTGVAGVSLRGLGSGSTLVLVDGRRLPIAGQGNLSTDSRQGFVDLNTIPLGMVESIEVLGEGASALYGSDAIGGVINVVLKKNYTGAELDTSYRGTFAGGARERRATLSAGFTGAGARLRGLVMLDLHTRDPLRASQRDFSRQQDHRGIVVGRDAAGAPVFGRDYRLNWGYPAVVQARTGTLDALSTRVALVPEGARTTPAAADFIPVPGNTASGARRFATAEFLALVPAHDSRGARGSFEYAATDSLRAYGGFLYNEGEGRFDAQPPASTAASFTGFGNFSTVVPALISGQPNAFNPFAQDVVVGLVHTEFGPMRQSTRTVAHGLNGGVSGRAGDRWTWDANVSWERQRFARSNLTLDFAKFTAALAAPDIAQRFNPFLDARATGPVHRSLYDSMGVFDDYRGKSEFTNAAAVAQGPLATLPAGDLHVALGAELGDARHRAVSRPSVDTGSDRRAWRRTHAAFAEAAIPLLAPAADKSAATAAAASPLQLQLAARYERHGDAGETIDPKAGVLWQPHPSVLARASFSTGFRAPSLTEYQTAPTFSTLTLSDPRHTAPSTPGVRVQRGSRADLEPETSRSERYGLVLTPAFARGLTLSIDYFRTRQRQAIQQLSPQTLVNNEALFPERITRAPPSTDELAAGNPGRIVAVDATLINFGRVDHESLDLRLDYDLPEHALGKFRFSVNGTHTLAARTALRPGVASTDLVQDTGAPPRWRGIATLLWRRGGWHSSVFVSHIGKFSSNLAGHLLAPQGYPSMTTVNLHVGHTFSQGIWRGHGKDVRIGLGLENIFDRAPPFSDTVFGYNGGLHSPLGRAYSFSLNVPF